MILPWLLHRKPALWENSACFDPERFAQHDARVLPTFRLAPAHAFASVLPSP